MKMKHIILILSVILFCSPIEGKDQVSFLKKTENTDKTSVDLSQALSTSTNTSMNINTNSTLVAPVIVYQGICFVKIHGWIYDLNPMNKPFGEYI